ncbi:type 1 glutamine amidotransferase [Larsenimonas salina]|uniref:type 1 glutamine amidotransferase n=1 Tax=Larsenimonas salina TaxID=1295565 RepID=UPI00207432BD|nr:type 1 glutamine amidotransferase [Larsenimonas salina]MCM5705200.1 type 1 glutamine amidotransferase [Larsenimonas salina]
MHIYFLQHSDEDAPARLADWLTGMGHSYNVCELHKDEVPPRPSNFDALVVLGGPSPVSGDAQLGWSKRERQLIDRILKSNKPLLGLGLGAELIAEQLGAVVSPAASPEIGWHTVTRHEDCALPLPETFDLFQWRERVFGLPEGCTPIGASTASPVQGFSWDYNRVIALQGHPEATPAWARAQYNAKTAIEGPYTQFEADALDIGKRFDRLAPILDRLMLAWLNELID